MTTETEARKLHATIATALDGAFRGGGTLKTSPPKVTITVEQGGVEMRFQKVELASLLRGIYQGLREARADALENGELTGSSGAILSAPMKASDG